MSLDQIPPEAQKVLQLTMLLSGIVMITISTYLLIDPASIEALIGFDRQTTQIFAFALLLAGAMDMALSLIVFRKKDKK